MMIKILMTKPDDQFLFCHQIAEADGLNVNQQMNTPFCSDSSDSSMTFVVTVWEYCPIVCLSQDVTSAHLHV